MRKRAAIFVAALALIPSLIGILAHGTRSHEPAYDGRPLSGWLSDLYHNSHFYFPTNDPEDVLMGPRRERASAAVRSIGTSAIPCLLSMTAAKDSRLKEQLWALANKQTVVRIPPIKTRERRYWASMGFDVLGPGAKSAQPALVNMALSNTGEVRTLALFALYQIDQGCYRDTKRLIEDREPKAPNPTLHSAPR